MKNIHVLPTEKPSRLMIDTIENKLYLQPILHEKTINVLTQNIYITSNEEIKDGYVLHLKTQEVLKVKGVGEKSKEIFHSKGFSYSSDCKKIILTTDQDLIKDGVQAIDDEFLEWFVNNPSCEEVQVIDDLKYFNIDELRERHLKGLPHLYSEKIGYKINIPKEIGFKVENGKRTETFYQEPKQETLEEVAERLFPTNTNDETINYQNTVRKPNWLQGAKWQQERMYSKEEVDRILRNFRTDFLPFGQVNDFALNNWFKKFKKK